MRYCCATYGHINPYTYQGGKGHWAVYYTNSPQSFTTMFSYLLASQPLGLLLNIDRFVYLV